MNTKPNIITAPSVTSQSNLNGAVFVAGSHGGLISCQIGAQAGAGALVLNDAGVGKEQAGIAGLAWCDGIGLPAATVAHISARIGDGADGLANGVISHVNHTAAKLGVRVGMRCADAAECLAQKFKRD